MIAPKNTNYNALKVNKERTVRAALMQFNQKPLLKSSCWTCDVCGMIHHGVTPLACESCGSELLTRLPNQHIEMNSRW